MNFFKWLGFLVFYPITTSIVYYVFINLTTALGLWLISKMSLFTVIFLGGIIQSIIYTIVFGGAMIYISFISQSIPKGGVAKGYMLIINVIVAFLTFRTVYFFSDVLFDSTKGILLGLSLVPIYLGVLYYTFLQPFMDEDF